MKIKEFLFLGIFLLSILPLGAQDIIYKYSGETIEAVVTDISPGVIKYKKYGHQKGAVYSIARDQVEKIKYESGRIITFEKSKRAEKLPDSVMIAQLARPSPIFGWHIGLGGSDLYGDIMGHKMQFASAIGATLTIPVGRTNTIMLEADILSLGCRFDDIDTTFDDGTRLVITDANEDLGYLSLLVTDRIFLNENRNYFLEGGLYGSFLTNAISSGYAEITDTLGVVTNGNFEDSLLEFYKLFDFGIAAGCGGRIPLDKNRKWHLSAGVRFYYGLSNIVDADNLTGFEDYSESNIFGFFFIGADIPTKTKQ